MGIFLGIPPENHIAFLKAGQPFVAFDASQPKRIMDDIHHLVNYVITSSAQHWKKGSRQWDIKRVFFSLLNHFVFYPYSCQYHRHGLNIQRRLHSLGLFLATKRRAEQVL
ncbi:hypothetical protein AVEN_232084-1 [Araneus ventricosus]|uniref:Uncharacterized protein n=1 Tax=Araneus ventricosus TaxID=182803 RepID=A0A4Y2SA87_ARAVE|nr:hypothetical protein AVEN_232084-1 [Araneus ventricosus]